MEKREILSIVAGVLILAVIFGIIGMDKKNTSNTQYVFRYAENHPENYPTTQGAYKFAELVEERTEGRIKILVQAEGELGDETSVIQQIQFGGIDFARVSVSPLSEVVTRLNVLQMPYLYRDSEHMWNVLEGKIGEDFLQAISEESDMVALTWYDAGARNFYNSKRIINCIEDMEGLKIRVQESELMSDMIKVLGAEPVQMSYGEVYSSLERNIIDGAENNIPSYESSEHYEIAGYYTIDEHTRVPEIQICSKHTWDKLSEEDRAIILQCSKESGLYERQLWADREKESEEVIKRKGVTIVELSDKEKARFQQSVKHLYEIYCKDYMDIIEDILNNY